MKPTNPYPGLRPFSKDEADVFCGRRDHKLQLLRLLESNRFAAVLGTSGSGKSSLVIAGLLPDIKKGFLVGVVPATCTIVQASPGLDPFGNLADALAKKLGQPKDLKERLRAGAAALTQSVQCKDPRRPMPSQATGGDSDHEAGLGAPASTLVIYIDQFEELFNYMDQGAPREGGAVQKAVDPKEEALSEAQAFVSLLLDSAAQTAAAIYVIISMRSDFVWRCEELPGLAIAVSRSQFHTPRLKREQLEEAIRRPLEDFNAKIEDRLVATLLNQAPGESDQLPLLQHVLFRLWTVASRKTAENNPVVLKTDDFLEEPIGGYDQALELQGEEVLNAVENEGYNREQVRRIFCALADLTMGAQPGQMRSFLWVRRRRLFMNLADETDLDKAALTKILKHFREQSCSFVLPEWRRDRSEALEDKKIIQVSHEALFRRWPTLNKWLEQDRAKREAVLTFQQNVDKSAAAETEETRTTRGWVAKYGRFIYRFIRGTPELAPAWVQNLAGAHLDHPPSEYDERWGSRYNLPIRKLHQAWRENARALAINNGRRWVLPTAMILMLALFGVVMYTQKQNNELLNSNADLALANRNKEDALAASSHLSSSLVQALKERDVALQKEKRATMDANNQRMLADKNREEAIQNAKKLSELQDEDEEQLLETLSSPTRRGIGATPKGTGMLDESNIRSLFFPRVIFAARTRPLKASAPTPVLRWFAAAPNSEDADGGEKLLFDSISDSSEGRVFGNGQVEKPSFLLTHSVTSPDFQRLFGITLGKITVSNGVNDDYSLPRIADDDKVTALAVDPRSSRGYAGTAKGGIAEFTEQVGAKKSLTESGWGQEIAGIVPIATDMLVVEGKSDPLGIQNGSEIARFSPDLKLSAVYAVLGTKERWLVSKADNSLCLIETSALLSKQVSLPNEAIIKLALDPGEDVRSVAVSHDDKLLAVGTGIRQLSGEDKGRLLIWSSDSADFKRGLAGDEIVALAPDRVLQGHLDAVTSLAWGNQRKNLLVSGDQGGRVLIWPSVASGSQLGSVRFSAPFVINLADEREQSVRTLAISPSDETVAAGTAVRVVAIPLHPHLILNSHEYQVHSDDTRQRADKFFDHNDQEKKKISVSETLGLIQPEDVRPGGRLAQFFTAPLDPARGLATQLDSAKNYLSILWDKKFTPKVLVRRMGVRVTRVVNGKEGRSISNISVMDSIDRTKTSNEQKGKALKFEGARGDPLIKAVLSRGLVQALQLGKDDQIMIDFPLFDPNG